MSSYRRPNNPKKHARSSDSSRSRGGSMEQSIPEIDEPADSETSHSPVLSNSNVGAGPVAESTRINEESSKTNIKSQESDEYRPMPYTFRVPISTTAGGIKNGLARSPPFYLQLDHVLAVIWCLFSKNEMERPLGIAQLQWALNFLKRIHNEDGEHPKDVSVCILAIQDELIQQYAELSETVKTGDEICVTPGCKCPRTQSSTSTEALIIQQLPFSVNYEEMNKNCPGRLEQLFRANDTCGTDTQLQKDHDCYKKAAASGICLNRTCSTNMMDFLKTWRKEQIDKIQQELQRLNSIETCIGNADKDNMSSFLDDKQLTMLSAEKCEAKPQNSTKRQRFAS